MRIPIPILAFAIGAATLAAADPAHPQAAAAAQQAQQQAQAWAAAHPDEVAQAKASQAKAAAARVALDSNGSGAITQDEWQAGSDARRDATRAKAGGRAASRNQGAGAGPRRSR